MERFWMKCEMTTVNVTGVISLTKPRDEIWQRDSKWKCHFHHHNNLCCSCCMRAITHAHSCGWDYSVVRDFLFYTRWERDYIQRFNTLAIGISHGKSEASEEDEYCVPFKWKILSFVFKRMISNIFKESLGIETTLKKTSNAKGFRWKRKRLIYTIKRLYYKRVCVWGALRFYKL